MSKAVAFKDVSTAGLESSPVADALAGLRANEARYFMNKYKHAFTVLPAGESQDTLAYVTRVLKEERDIEFAAKPLQTSRLEVEGIRMAYVFYEDGLAVNVMGGAIQGGMILQLRLRCRLVHPCIPCRYRRPSASTWQGADRQCCPAAKRTACGDLAGDSESPTLHRSRPAG